MKNARKETGAPATDKARATTPDDFNQLSDPVFSEKSSPRQPESPHVESLRAFLKANLSREKASPALVHRIRSRMQEDKS